MKPWLKTRKPIDELRIADIEAFPIWEFATDEEEIEDQDENWVRPLQGNRIPRDAYSLSVSAIFSAPSGAKYKGIVSVSTAQGFDAVHAALLTDDNYVFVPWPGTAGASKMARDAAREMGSRASDLFPLSYRLAVPVEDEESSREGLYSYGKSAA